MQTLGSIKRPLLRILGYGESGSGKSRFGASMTSVFGANKTLVENFDPEHNLLPYITAGLSEINFNQFKGVAEEYDVLLTEILRLKRFAAKPDEFPYNLIIIENGAGMHSVVMRNVLKLTNRADVDWARIQDWGISAERLKERIKDFFGLPCHLYVTFHSQVEKDEAQGKILGRILVPGRLLPDEIPPMFNMFLHFKTRAVQNGVEYKIYTASDNLFPAGDKTGALDYIEEMDFKKLWDKIDKKLSMIIKET